MKKRRSITNRIQVSFVIRGGYVPEKFESANTKNAILGLNLWYFYWYSLFFPVFGPTNSQNRECQIREKRGTSVLIKVHIVKNVLTYLIERLKSSKNRTSNVWVSKTSIYLVWGVCLLLNDAKWNEFWPNRFIEFQSSQSNSKFVFQIL